MIRRSLFFLIVVIINATMFAQNTNYLIYSSESVSHGPAGMISLSDGSIIIAGTELISGTDPDQKSAFMYKVDENGNLLDEKRL